MSDSSKPLSPATVCAHGPLDPSHPNPPLAVPIVTASTFAFEDQAAIERHYNSGEGNVYTRYGNPTVQAAEAFLAALDRAEACALFASGMAAISTLMLHFGKSGGTIAAQTGLYGGSLTLLHELMPEYGAKVKWIPVTDLSDLTPADLEGCSLLYLESPVNPSMRIVDLEKVASVARKSGVPTAVDATFAPPTVQCPIELGIDLVVHSVTKYLGGHSDLTGGGISGSTELVEALRARRLVLGGVLDAFSAFLLQRGMRTLDVRMQRHSANALEVARALDASPLIERVYYPGLTDHPDHALAKRTMRGFGGMVSFDVKGGYEKAVELHDKVKLIARGGSLGGTESLISLPSKMSHRKVKPEARAAEGIGDGMVRLSVGLEDAGEIIADLLG